jgi:3D (Asp-Asp-Asp) domain-containing protein
MLIEAVLLGTMTVTSYRALPAQTKSTCIDRHHCETSIGENVSELGVAVSPDLLTSGRVHYHDCVYIPGIGYRIVNDTTNQRLYNHIDVFVYEAYEEKKFGVRRLKAWVIQLPKTKIAGKETK